MKRYAIYKRVSTEDQVDGTSLDTQEKDCISFIKAQGGIVVEVYQDEGISGSKKDRPGLLRLLDDAKRKKFDFVVIWKYDRLARDTYLHLDITYKLQQYNIHIVSVTERIDDTTSTGKYMINAMASSAQLFRDMLAERMTRALAHTAEHGRWVGPVPLGYKRGDNGNLVKTADAEIIELIYSLYLSGTYSYSDIADELNQRGYRTLKWQTGERNLFGRESVRTVLKNRAYCGYVSSGGVEYQGNHTPLINEDLWNQAAQLRAARTAKGGKSSLRSGGILTQLIFCARCGKRMWYHHSGRRGEGRYYMCSGNNHRTCDAPMASSSFIEEKVIQMLESLSIPQDWYELIIARAESILTAQQSQPTIDRAAIEEQLQRLGMIFTDGLITHSEYIRRRDGMRALLLDAPPPQDPLPNLREAAGLLSNLKRLIGVANQDQLRTISHQLFTRFWVERREIRAITPTKLYLPLVVGLAFGIGAVVGAVGVYNSHQPPQQHIDEQDQGTLVLPSIFLPPIWIDFNQPWQPAASGGAV